jgi:multiple antibiotic resistance protein
MGNDLRLVIEGALLVFAALLPIVNPLGGAPVFLAMTADCSPALRASMAKRIGINAFFLLVGSVAVGSYVLAFFGLSIPIVQVGGGIVVCAAGWDLLRSGEDAPPAPAASPSATAIASRAFYPLTLPLTVGPGSISVAITLGAHHPASKPTLLVAGLANLAGVTLIAATIFVCFRYADRILRRIGPTGTNVLVRLSAFILLCIGVQIAWSGVSALIATLPAAVGRD